VRVALEALLHLQGQPMHAAPHVGVAARDSDADSAGYGDHAPIERRTAVTSLGGASAAIRTTAPPISTISAASDADPLADAPSAACPGATITAAKSRTRSGANCLRQR